MTGDRTNSGRIRTSETVFGIIEILQQRDGATLTEVASALDIAPSTAHAHLQTLVDMEYLVKRDSEYLPSLKFLDHGIYAKENYKISSVVVPVLRELAAKTGEGVWFMIEEHGQAVFLEEINDELAVAFDGRVGLRRDLHCISGGKAMLAEMTDERIESIVDRHGLSARTDSTITDIDDLFEELKTVRERGYALNFEESHRGLNGVASPVEIDETLLGAVVVAGPTKRMQGEMLQEVIPEKVQGASDALALKFTYE